VGLSVGFEQTMICVKRHLYGAGVDVRKARYNMSQRNVSFVMCDSNDNVGEERLINIVVAAARALVANALRRNNGEIRACAPQLKDPPSLVAFPYIS
jgi:hypothetical protein